MLAIWSDRPIPEISTPLAVRLELAIPRTQIQAFYQLSYSGLLCGIIDTYYLLYVCIYMTT